MYYGSQKLKIVVLQLSQKHVVSLGGKENFWYPPVCSEKSYKVHTMIRHGELQS